MSELKQLPKVVDLARWRSKKLELQSQEDYIRKLCSRCGAAGPPCCDDAHLRRLAEIQRQIILDLLGVEAGRSEEPKE